MKRTATTTPTTTPTVCFYNNGTLDHRAFTMLGLSAKSSDNAIGFFGTGFKYAIATLLRNECTVGVIVHNDDGSCTLYNFYTQSGTFRDKKFDFIYCTNVDTGDVIELPFTTHLGANWKLWQAYRELYTNAIDEGGDVELVDLVELVALTGNLDGNLSVGVCVYVQGKDFIDVYKQRTKYFLEADTYAASNLMRCVQRTAECDNVIYYKTMYTGTQLDKPTHFTYDYINTVDLTEDRTIADTWSIRHHISEVWLEGMTKDQLIEHLPLVASGQVYEHRLTSDYNTASKAFVGACAHLIKFDRPIPLWALDAYNKTRPFNEIVNKYKLNKFEQSLLNRVVKVMHHNGCHVDVKMIHPCVSLPDDMLGMFKDGGIYIAKETFERGFVSLLGTVYEEYLHYTKSCMDLTRKMQNMLVDKVANLMERVYEAELATTTTEEDD